MGIILLLDKKRCPKCMASKVVSPYGGNCRNCGVRLFPGTFNWHEYEQIEGNREWYAFLGKKGWVHRSHILDFDCKEVIELRPLDREYKLEQLPEDYGIKTAEERVSEMGFKPRVAHSPA